MSFANKNLFHLLGNDVEDEEPVLAPRELVKKSTSSKKKDEAPAKADPARAKSNKKAAAGNEGALKTKLDNKTVPGPKATPSSHYKKPLDRHSRAKNGTRKTKREDGETVLDEEIEAEQDALLEQEVSEEEIPQAPAKSLQDYFAELKVQQESLAGATKIRAANEGAEDKWTAAEKLIKEEAAYVPPTSEKKVKTKAPKEKKFLDFEADFVDSTPAPSTRGPSTRGRGGARGASSRGRGGARGGRGARGSSAPTKSSAKPALNEKNFPAL